MGISYDKKGYFSKDDLYIYKSNQKKTSGKNIMKSEEGNTKRHNSAHTKENPLLIKKIKSQLDKNAQENEKDEENLNCNLTQNNKIYKCLSYEKLEKIEEPNKTTNPNEIYNSLYEGGKSHSSNIEIRKKSIDEDEKDEDIYKEMDNNNSIEEGSDINSNSNSASNKELQIIDENMKSLFLNKTKSTKENTFTNVSNIKDDKSSLSNNSIQESEYELNFYKTANELRKSYIQKLVTKALYLPNNKPKTHNSLIIFDWDDTLLPTSFLTQDGIFNENLILSESERKKIEKLESSALKLLDLAIKQGDVYIITNAGLGWVEYSAQKFYPKVCEVLPKIQIISARGEWEKDYPGDSRKWKIQTFLSLQKKLNTKLVTNIICLGDSLFEIEAGRVLATCFSEAFVKTIKFKEGPKPEELNKQLLLVANQFNSICSAIKNLTIRVEKKKKGSK